MIKLKKSDLKAEIEKYLELGLTNAEIADRMNEIYGADEKNKLNALKVGKLKKMVGLEGTKPKGKQLFELLDDEEETQSYQQIEQELIEDFTNMGLEEDVYEPEFNEPFPTNPNAIY